MERVHRVIAEVEQDESRELVPPVQGLAELPYLDTVWAAGDRTSRLQCTHVGDEQGRPAAKNVLAGAPRVSTGHACPTWSPSTRIAAARLFGTNAGEPARKGRA